MIVRVTVPLLLIGGLAIAVMWWPRGSGESAAGSDTWTCSMHPQIRLPNPGRCPICGMQLIPISKLPSTRSDLETRAGLITEPIRRRELFKELRTVGKLDYSERQVAYITSRMAGRVDRLFVDFAGVEVKKGDHLVEIYSPELYAAQAELIGALKAAEPSAERRLVDQFTAANLLASREKLRLLGLLPEQIAEIERTRKELTHVTIYAPLAGTVIEKSVRVGQYLNTGDQVYRIADLDPIWLYLNIYEFDIAWVRFGQAVEVQLEAFPGEVFSGSIMFIDPFLDDATRSIRVRVNIKNPNRLLKPQMFGTATINVKLRPDGSPEPTGLEGMFVCPMHPEVMQQKPGKCSICDMPLEKVPERRSPDAAPDAASGEGVLAIPVSAVLDTGRRRIAYRHTDDGAYELVEIRLGPRAHSMDESGKRREFFVVLDGIDEGERVVAQSGFLLDSQRQIEGMPSLLYPTGQAGTSLHSGHGGMEGAASKKEPQPAPAGHQH
ncbi:MAG: efflux RND transporter periplasmic adaptor subunit [Pirellulales bacterium]